MSYKEKLMEGRVWIYGIGIIIVAVVAIWRALHH
jgi:hypothetical protein